MYLCIMHQCFGVGTSYGSWLGLTTLAQGWDVTGDCSQHSAVKARNLEEFLPTLKHDYMRHS
jgi:hypothetical protein